MNYIVKIVGGKPVVFGTSGKEDNGAPVYVFEEEEAFDAALAEGMIPVGSIVIKTYDAVEMAGGPFDTELSDQSENAPQNKAVKEALDGVAQKTVKRELLYENPSLVLPENSTIQIKDMPGCQVLEIYWGFTPRSESDRITYVPYGKTFELSIVHCTQNDEVNSFVGNRLFVYSGNLEYVAEIAAIRRFSGVFNTGPWFIVEKIYGIKYGE